MTTKDIIKRMEKEFNRRVGTNKMDLYPSIRTLLESFGEEIIGESENISGSTDYRISWGLLGRNKLKAEQRLKMKEILEVIK